MRRRCSTTIAGAVLAAGLASTLVGGCGRPDDDAWVRFLGFRQAGSEQAVSVVKGQLDGTYDETTDPDSVLDAAFANVSAGQADINGTGILINRARVEYSLSGAPVYEYPVTLYLAPPAKAGETTSGTLAGLPLVPPALEDWVIANVSPSKATFTARVTFFAEADEGTELDVSGGITIILEASGGSVPTPTATTVTIEATTATAVKETATKGVFTVSRTGSTTSALTIGYVAGGDAVPDFDYEILSDTVVIPTGAISAAIDITPIPDNVGYGDVGVTISLKSGTGYALGSPNYATVMIKDSL